jgi:hypothetical protein
MLSFVLGGYGAYLLALYALRTVHRSRFIIHSAAFLAGVIFAFSPYHFAHLLGHLQLIALQWIPFYVLYLIRGLDRAEKKPGFPIEPRNQISAPARDALMAGLFLILVGLVDWYYVMYCLMFTGLLLAIRLVQRRLTRRGVGVVAGALAVFGLALSPLLLPMMQAAATWTGTSLLRGFEETRVLSADLLAFVTPQVFHPLWGDWAQARSARFTATPSEYTVFTGFTVLALCAIALVTIRTRREQSDFSRKSRTAALSSASPGLYLLSAAVFALLALGPALKINGQTALLPGGGEIPLPYRLLYEFVPFIKLSRSVSRMDVMVMLFLGVGAAFGVAALVDWVIGRLGHRLNGKWVNWQIGRWVAVGAVALVIFEFWPAPYPVSPPDTPAWYETLAQDPNEGAVLNLPANYERPWYLLYQTAHGKPLATGYVTRDDPAILRERAPVLSHFWFLGPDIQTQGFDLGRQGIQVLHDLLGVRWVALDRYKMPGGPEREVTEAYAQAIFAGQPPLYEDERITVYAVPEPVQRGPYLILGTDWQGRQAGDDGQVWRELPAGQPASLESINPSGAPLGLEVDVAAPAGGLLALLDSAGRELATWRVSQERTTLASGPLEALRASPAAVRLVYQGPPGASAQIERLALTP